MSWLSKLSGVHISPKGVRLSAPDPIGTVKDIAHNPLPLLGALAIPGVGGLLGEIPGLGAVGGALSHIPGASKVGSLLGIGGAGNGAFGGAIPDAAMGIPSSSGGLGGLVGKLGGGGFDLSKLLQAASGAEGVYNTLQSNKYRGQAIDLAKQQNATAAPLRAAAQSKLLNSAPPDLSSVYQNPQNPFSPHYRSLS